MMDGEKCYEMYMSGMTYKKIAEFFNENRRDFKPLTRNDIAAKIYDYRIENNIKPDYGNRGKKAGELGFKSPEKKIKKRKSFLTKSEKEAAQQRAAAIQQCHRNENGIIQCPPAYASGYGIKRTNIEEAAGWR